MYSTVISNKCGSKAYILSVVALDVHVDYAHKHPDDDHVWGALPSPSS